MTSVAARAAANRIVPPKQQPKTSKSPPTTTTKASPPPVRSKASMSSSPPPSRAPVSSSPPPAKGPLSSSPPPPVPTSSPPPRVPTSSPPPRVPTSSPPPRVPTSSPLSTVSKAGPSSTVPPAPMPGKLVRQMSLTSTGAVATTLQSQLLNFCQFLMVEFAPTKSRNQNDLVHAFHTFVIDLRNRFSDNRLWPDVQKLFEEPPPRGLGWTWMPESLPRDLTGHGFSHPITATIVRSVLQGFILRFRNDPGLVGTGRATLAVYASHLPSQTFDDMYDTLEHLGSGATGVVYKCRQKATGKLFAVKKIGRHKATQEDLKTEEAMLLKLRNLQHPNLNTLVDVFEDAREFQFVLELCAGGELYERIVDEGHFSEADACLLMRQMILGIAYLHSVGAVHRDIKPENIMFLNKETLDLKICDFGFSKFFTNSVLTTMCGTPIYIAPEILSGVPYTAACDVWSLGVVLYIILTARQPFDSREPQNVLFNKIRRGDYKFYEDDWKDISVEARSLVAQMMDVNPATRLSLDTAFSHPWFRVQLSRASLKTGALQTLVRRHPQSPALPPSAMAPAELVDVDAPTFNDDGVLP